MEQLEQGLMEEVAQSESADVVAQLVFREAHLAQFDDGGPDDVFGLEEATGLFPRLEDEGQLGELRGAGADLQAVEIMPQDQGGNLDGGVAFLLVNEEKQVEGVGEHVAGAYCGVEELDLLGGGNGEVVGRNRLRRPDSVASQVGKILFVLTPFTLPRLTDSCVAGKKSGF